MRLFSWLKRRRGGKPNASDRVKFYDFSTQQLAEIPASELRPGCIEMRVEGIEGVVWGLAESLKAGPIRYAPFDEETRAVLREIRDTFSEHMNLSLEEWEDGFRRDKNPEREIALFVHGGKIYREFVSSDASTTLRKEIYGLIVACMSSSPESVWHVVTLDTLSRKQAEKIVSSFYGGKNTESAPTIG